MSASDQIASPLPAGSAAPRAPRRGGLLALAASWVRSCLPRRTVRLRLTLMYGGLFLISGAALLATTYLLVKGSGSEEVTFSRGGVQGSIVGRVPGISPGGAQVFQVHVQTSGTAVHVPESAHASGHASESTHAVLTPVPGSTRTSEHVFGSASAAGGASESTIAAAPVLATPKQVQSQVRQLHTLATQQHSAELHQLLTMSGIALAIMAVASMGLGWLIAGRVLRPLHKITSAAREISASNLHERLALEGPDDELTELGDTFDGLLSRLESSFQSQRQFVANASHELRTPLTVERALLEVALADPDGDYNSLRAACERVLASSEEQERLIEALLTLASSERGLERREPVDLGALTGEALDARRAEIERLGLSMSATIDMAPTQGDPRLIGRLVANLLDNALRHNVSGGWIEIAAGTGGDGRGGFISISNSGPVIRPEEVEPLFRPFQRLAPDRAGHVEGNGLGLSIVQAIAAAHEASVTASALAEGGLVVEVGFRQWAGCRARAE
jgi:signal transduction histidine kinase